MRERNEIQEMLREVIICYYRFYRTYRANRTY
ncbi:MAG: hypothetical protein PHE84_02570 [bacterium]|nr:hypothetical protein [bacterium]